MKKIIASLLLVCMLLALAACGSTAPAANNEQPAEQAEEPAEQAETPAEQAEEPAEQAEEPAEQAEEPAEQAEEPAEAAAYTLGMGIVVSFDDADTNNAQVDNTVAAVVTDAEGKIVAARIDVAQNKMNVTDGQVDLEAQFLTKAEKGDDYNMVKFSNATHEWYEQAAAFEEYCVGKTAAEIAGMETTVNEEGHPVTTDETLYASCSIAINEFQEAIVKACEDSQSQSFTTDGSFTLGLAATTKVDESSASATAEADGAANMYTDFGAAVVDADGKIIVALTDATQPKIAINAAGEIVGTTFNGTKRELKEDYNMVKFSNATLEWYEQAKNFVDYAAGKTAEELQNTETVTNEEGHPVFADETLFASVSISLEGMIEVLVKAVSYAR